MRRRCPGADEKTGKADERTGNESLSEAELVQFRDELLAGGDSIPTVLVNAVRQAVFTPNCAAAGARPAARAHACRHAHPWPRASRTCWLARRRSLDFWRGTTTTLDISRPEQRRS
jgi:hypothetical protein